MKSKHVILLLCFVAAIAAATTQVKKRNQIVDANHYFSEDNKQKGYTITQLQKNKPIAVVIKPSPNTPYTNQITLTVRSGDKKKQCKFRSFEDICVLESAPDDKGELGIKCQKLPCEVYWNIYQPEAQQLKSGDRIQNLYKLQKNPSGLFINLFCEVPGTQVAKQDHLVLAFSDSNFSSIAVSPTSHYIVFEEIKQDGYVYFTVNPKYQTCTKVKVYKGTNTLSTQGIQSYLKKDKKAEYTLQNVPDNKNFVIEMAFHALLGSGFTSDVFISITAVSNGQKKILRNNKISFSPEYKSFDLSYGIPKIDLKTWKDVKLQLQTQNPILLTQILYKTTQVIQVQATQFSYFDLKAGQKLLYKLIQQKKAEEADTVNIFSSDKQSLKISKSTCNVKAGCQFQIQAIKDVHGNIYLGKGDGKSKQIIILQFGKQNSFTHKIKQLQSVYIKKTLKQNKAIQVTINSPNIVVYLASVNKCKFPTQQCYQKTGSINKHFIYNPGNQTQVIFKVNALDTCQFTITLLEEDTQYVDLIDSQPFVYLFDKQQKQLRFRFVRKQKVDVSFNLIGPVQALDLIAANGKKIPEDEDALISTQGYLQFKSKQAPKNQFVILVRRRQSYGSDFIHFTLIASTKGKFIRLQSGITHYQTLPKKTSNNAQYVFSFNPGQDYFVNFYCHNTKQQQINIKLQLRALQNKQVDSKTVSRLVIDKPSDALDLSDVSKQLCAAVDTNDNCQIALFLQNQMDLQIDIAITLMSQHTILELKDGLWQSFSLNSVAKSTHFYFFPRNKNQDISLLFKTTDPAIRLKYRMFYGSDTEVDPSVWPFPIQSQKSQAEQMLKHKPINHFGISKSSMKQCWPNCVVLVSVIQLQKKQMQGSFSIMASNSIMEIPEKQKIDLTLKQGQSKAYLVDLKYAIDIEQNIYFYISHSIGLTQVYANVYSQKSDRIPEAQNFDFQLNSQRQTIVPIQKIKQVIKNEQMDEHINLYLYIVVQSITDAKVSIQFAFKQLDEQSQKLIGMDTFEHLMLGPRQQKIYYSPIYQPYEVKIIRDKGFPLYSAQVCQKQLDQCLKQMKQNDKSTQILQKVAAYTATPCANCLYLFKIKTQSDPVDVTIHLQSKTSQIQLVENKAVYDFTQKSQQNHYVFYAIRGQQIYVNIHVTQGQIQSQITDLGKLNQKKSGNKIISFIVPGSATQGKIKKNGTSKKLTKQQKQQLQKQQQALNSLNALKKEKAAFTQSLMSAFGLSDKFIQLHVSVKSSNPAKPSLYTISYSSGDRQFELQDGLITDYVLQPKKQTVFYYSTREAFHIYFTVSMQKSSFLKDLEIKLKYCEPKNNIIDDDCWVDYKTDNPTVKDKVPHPTLVYLLANKNHIAVFLTYNGDHSQKVSLGINHQQIMILPYDVEFPFILHSNQTIDFLVEISNNGYIEIVTRKCDQSNPTFAYTFDYDSFQNNQFTYQAELGANPKSKFMSKVKQGVLYMQMKTQPGQSSVLSVMVRYSQKKIVDAQILAGNKGNLDYSIVDSANGLLKFSPPTCPDSKCPKFKYSIMSAPKMIDLYSQLVCPSNFFTNVEFQTGGPVKLTEVTPKQNSDGTLEINFPLLDQISYVGIKASNGKDKQVFYKPIQVATFWGQLSRTSHSHKLTIASLFICAMVGIIICVSRSARRGYKPIQDQI